MSTLHRWNWVRVGVLPVGLLAACSAGGDAATDAEDTDLDTESDEEDTDEDDTDDTDPEEETDVVFVTDPPTVPVELAGYELIKLGTIVEVVWPPASDDETEAADLQYRGSCKVKESAVAASVSNWLKPASYDDGGEGRLKFAVCRTPGTQQVFIEVRDAEGQAVKYPQLEIVVEAP